MPRKLLHRPVEGGRSRGSASASRLLLLLGLWICAGCGVSEGSSKSSAGGLESAPVAILGDSAVFGLPVVMKVVGEHLVVGDAHDSPRLTVIRVRDAQIEKRLAPAGNEPGQLQAPWFMFAEPSNPHRVWSYDVGTRRFTLWDLTRPADSAAIEHVPFRMRVGVAARPLLLPGSVIVDDLFEGYTLALGNNAGPSIEVRIGTPPFASAEFPQRPSAHMEANEYFPVADPSRARIALLYKHIDRVDVFDVEARQLTVVEHGSDLPRPRLSRQDSWDVLPDAYVNGQDATARYIYSMYCGCKTAERHRGRRAHVVRVFDWSGQLVAEVRLDRYLTALAVSPNDSVLYGAMTDPAPMIGQWILPAELRQ